MHAYITGSNAGLATCIALYPQYIRPALELLDPRIVALKPAAAQARIEDAER